MDRNTVVGIVLIAGIIIFWGWYNKPTPEQIREKEIRDSIAQVERQREIQAQEELQRIRETQEEQQAAIPDSVNKEKLSSLYGSFASAAKGEDKTYVLENNKVRLVISSKGGKILSAELKGYKTHQGEPLLLFYGENNTFSLNFFAENRSLNTEELYFEPVGDTEALMARDEAKSLVLRAPAGDNKYLEFAYTMYPDQYMMDYTILFKGLENVISTRSNSIDLNWVADIPSQEKGRDFENRYTSLYLKHFEDDVEHLSTSSDEDIENVPTRLKWIAYKQQFFATALLTDQYFSNASLISRQYEEGTYLKNFESKIALPLDDAFTEGMQLHFYFGPNHFQTLKNQEVAGNDDLDLQEMVRLGWWGYSWINKWIVIPVFNWLDNFIGSYGLIILLLTLLIKLVLFPLTYTSYMSMARMRVLKPQIEEATAKIPKDKPMERQQATMAIYRKAGVSPLGGCLPMLLQMPILIALFQFFPASIELRQESFLWADDLSSYDAIVSWTANIPLISQYYGNHVSLFCLLMGITNLIYTVMNQEMTSSASSQQMPGMKTMMYFMPLMFMIFFNNYASGLSYYYFVSTLITIGQTLLIRRFIDEKALLAKLNAKTAKPKKKSGWVKRLEEMQRQQQAQGGRKRKR